MCNLYNLPANAIELGEKYRATIQRLMEFTETIAPRKPAPTLLVNDVGERELLAMRFGLTPVGSKEPESKMPLNNARVEKLDKWPWSVPVRSQRCVVPMQEFREPLYWGNDAGTQSYFFASDGSLLSVAGLYNIWRSPDKQTELATMTLLMRPACDYLMENGHHRMPFFLAEEGIDEWISADKRPLATSLHVLRDNAFEPELQHRVSVEMKPAWKSRQKQHLKKRDEQLADIDKFGPLGI